jgi:multicomponent K+:H+ antiporter subunit E
MFERWLPNPLATVGLTVCWLMLNNSVMPGHLLLGLLLGVVIPLFSRRFWPEPVSLRKPGVALRFAVTVLTDIVVANFAVAALIVIRPGSIRPAIVKVPLDVEDEFSVTLLASVISLTPGTVSADMDPERTHLLVHVLDLDDEQALIDEVKTRYEAPIKEAFS